MADKTPKETRASVAPSAEIEPELVPIASESAGEAPAEPAVPAPEPTAEDLLRAQFIANGASEEEAAQRAASIVGRKPKAAERELLCAEYVRSIPGAIPEAFRLQDQSTNGVRRLPRSAWDEAYNKFLSTERS